MPLALVEPVVLAGHTVRLEPLSADHVESLARFAFEPELWRWTASRVTDRSALEVFVAEALAAQRAGSALPFATVLLRDGGAIGSTRFGNIARADDRVEIGWTWIGLPHQRSAVNTEAKLLMLTHAFETLGAVRVELKTHALNEKSRTAMERLGARFEGIHRKHMLMPDGTRRDTAWYAILDDEWPATKVRLTAMLSAHGPTATR